MLIHSVKSKSKLMPSFGDLSATAHMFTKIAISNIQTEKLLQCRLFVTALMLCIMPYDLILQTVLHFLYIFCKRELQKDDVFNNVEETFKLIVAENKH